MLMKNDEEATDVYDLTYAWPVNILRYEARIFGLSIIEIGAVIAGLLVPMVVVGLSLIGVGVSAMTIVTLLLLLRRIERLGNSTIPMFVMQRLRDYRAPRTVMLSLIMGAAATEIRVYDPETDTHFTVQ
jgi:hypothetical protein